MSNLSNLYISQSYKGLINLADSTKGIDEQSDYELQDGLGQGTGVSILSGSVLVENDISSSTLNGVGNVTSYSASVDLRLDDLEATASDHDPRVDAIEIYTSSLKEAFSVSGTNTQFLGDISVSGSISAYELFVTVESASVILSSGSNQLGDEPSDTQIFSGSVYVPNLHYLGTSSIDTNTRLNSIVADALPSSWTGSVFLPFSSSVSSEIIALQQFSASLVLDTASFAEWTGSVFEPFSQSVDARILSNVAGINYLSSFTGSYATTGSNLFRGNQIISGAVTIQDVSPTPGTTFTIKTGGASPALQIDNNTLAGITGTAITLNGNSIHIGDNTQTGDYTLTGDSTQTGDSLQTGDSIISGSQDITGRLNVFDSASIDGGWHVTGSSFYSGSVRGNVHFVSSSTTASSDYTHSIDGNLGNFFDFYLKEGENYITQQNIKGGETITVKLNQPSGSQPENYGEVVWDTGSIKFPFLSTPQTTQGNNAIDVLTLVSFSTGSLFGVLGKNYL